MREYTDAGVRLGWLLDLTDRTVYVFESSGRERRLRNRAKIAGDPILAGFTLDLNEIW